jgi:hypothetical protein
MQWFVIETSLSFFIHDRLSKHSHFLLLDINECTLNPSPCSPIASCVNWIGGFNCTCPPGYGGNGIGPNGCVDINECLSSPCDPLANCTNTNGSFICTCPIGYNGTGIGPNSCSTFFFGLYSSSNKINFVSIWITFSFRIFSTTSPTSSTHCWYVTFLVAWCSFWND